MKHVDLVNSVITSLSLLYLLYDLTQMVSFPTHIPGFGSHSLALLGLFLSSDASICSTMTFPPFGNSDHVVSVSIDIPSYSQWDAPFQCIAYYYYYSYFFSCVNKSFLLNKTFAESLSLSLSLSLCVHSP